MVRVGAVRESQKLALPLDILYVHNVPKHAGGEKSDILFKTFHVSVLVHSL